MFLYRIVLPCVLLSVFVIQLMAQPFATGKEKFLGCAQGGGTPPDDFGQYWNQITPGNAGKWLYTEGNQGEFSWGWLDGVYQYAKNNGIPFRQHTFIWGNQQPYWIKDLDRETQYAAVENWIRSFGERYPDTDFIGGNRGTHYSIMRGSKANLVIRQGEPEKFISTLYIEPLKIPAVQLTEAFSTIIQKYPGVTLFKQGKGWQVIVPSQYQTGHKEHFKQVTEKFIDYFRNGKMPPWEVPIMLAKYYTTTKALELAKNTDGY